MAKTKQRKREEAAVRQEAHNKRTPRERLIFMRETGRAHHREAIELAEHLGLTPNIPSEW